MFGSWLVFVALVAAPLLCAWGWAGGYIMNKETAISPFSGPLSRDFDYGARSDRLRVWRRRAMVAGLSFGSVAALITWIVR